MSLVQDVAGLQGELARLRQELTQKLTSNETLTRQALDAALEHIRTHRVIHVTLATPTHVAREGTLVWDSVNNLFYVNNNSGTGWTNIAPAASSTVAGLVELATAAEINTGDDTERAITRKSLADSNLGVRTYPVPVIGTAIETTTGDGKVLIMIPKELDGMNLVDVGCVVFTAGTTNTLDVQVRNITKAQDMLSTVLKVASTAVVDDGNRVIDGTKDDVSTDDRLTVDLDAVHTTKAKGLTVLLAFQLP